MKKFLPHLLVLLGVGIIAMFMRPVRNPGAYDIVGFGRLPVLLNGRIKPLDTVARSSLLQFQGRQRLEIPSPEAGGKPRKLTPVEWLLDVSFRPEVADTYRTFEIVHPDLLALLGLTTDEGDGGKRFAYTQLSGKLAEIDRQARLAEQVEAGGRNPFQRGVLQLYGNLVHYQRLRHALVVPGRPDFLNDLLNFQDKLGPGVAAVRAKMAGQPHDEAAAKAMMDISESFLAMAESTNLLVVPPEPGEADVTAWKTAGAALLETFRTGRINTTALSYAGFAHAWRNNQPGQFNKLVELVRADLDKRFDRLRKSDVETRFNAAQPFYSSMMAYVLAGIVALGSWLMWSQELGRAAFRIAGAAWIASTVGIATRMWLEGRPPVTNLYSSALFVGWGAVAICLILERIFRNAIGTVAAGAIGFSTLLIAHHLSLTGDTLEMMRAVLDSNFWLGTHVVVVTLGYSATFLAGVLAIMFVVRGFFTSTLDKATADALGRMVYGVICFATLFSFVGTVLGGIWADQSWGRFWGWDPKENGALMVVIWNAIILHARWGGLVRQRGLMLLAIGGNIVTAWSWFGTNMLGVGLHSYGFTDAAFLTLVLFAVGNLALIGLGALPLRMWRSYRGSAVADPVDEPQVVAAK